MEFRGSAARLTEEVTDQDTGETFRLTLPVLPAASDDDDDDDVAEDVDDPARLSHCGSPSRFLRARKQERIAAEKAEQQQVREQGQVVYAVPVDSPVRRGRSGDRSLADAEKMMDVINRDAKQNKAANTGDGTNRPRTSLHMCKSLSSPRQTGADDQVQSRSTTPDRSASRAASPIRSSEFQSRPATPDRSASRAASPMRSPADHEKVPNRIDRVSARPRQPPRGACKKQKPKAKLWIERDIRIEGVSLNFYATGESARRGSSIDDLRGCSVELGRESFLGSGIFYKITLRRKGHYQENLPDLTDDGVSFAFQEEAVWQQFAGALKNLAAGRAWDDHSGGAQVPAVVKEGLLEKRGEKAGSDFLPRFMRLQNTTLSYYKTSDCSEPQGSLDMSTVKCVRCPGLWSWQSSRQNNDYTPYPLATCEKLDATYIARNNGGELASSQSEHASQDRVSVDKQHCVDMRDLSQMRQLRHGVAADRAGGADTGRTVKREAGKDIFVTALSAKSGSDKAGQFGRAWRVWHFRCHSASDAAEWTQALRIAMHAQECTPICCGVSMTLGSSGPHACSIEPCSDDAGSDQAQGLTHVVLQHATDPHRYDLASFEEVVSGDDFWFGGDYWIKAKLQIPSTASAAGRRVERANVILRFAKHCERERDRVLVAIARGGIAHETIPHGPSELRRSFKRVAMVAGAVAGVGGGATRAAMRRTGSGK